MNYPKQLNNDDGYFEAIKLLREWAKVFFSWKVKKYPIPVNKNICLRIYAIFFLKKQISDDYWAIEKSKDIYYQLDGTTSPKIKKSWHEKAKL